MDLQTIFKNLYIFLNRVDIKGAESTVHANCISFVESQLKAMSNQTHHEKQSDGTQGADNEAVEGDAKANS